MVLFDMRTHEVVYPVICPKKKLQTPSKVVASNVDRPPSPMAHEHQQWQPWRKGTVPNFRAVIGHKKIFRCAAPDKLGDVLSQIGSLSEEERCEWDEPERAILYDATLLLDLRMQSEIDTEQYRLLLQLAPGGSLKEVCNLDDLGKSDATREQFRPSGECGLSRNDIVRHAGSSWIVCKDWSKRDSDEKKQLVLEELNKRGLPGLYEIIAETGRYIRTVLQAMTMHLEKDPTGTVVLHCSIGKDRTGIIAMLCSNMVGMNDTEVIADYSKSFVIQELAVKKFRAFFGDKVDSTAFALSNKEALETTMEFLRAKYGSIAQYLDHVGFGSEWQSRFRRATA